MPRLVISIFSGGILALGCSGSPEVESHPGQCSIALPELSSHRLTAEGTTFRDVLGRQVVLRGVNAGGRSKFAPYVPFEFASDGFDAALAKYFDIAASWGIDVVRVPFTWAAVEPTKGQDDAAFLAHYDAILDAAWARGIRTIIDFHQDIYAENLCGDGFPAWTLPQPAPAPHHDCPGWSGKYQSDDAVRAAFDAFWADGSPVQAAYTELWMRLVARYRDRPGVIGFELINEPGWGTAPPVQFDATTLSAFFAKHVPLIRAQAPDALIFVEPTGLAGTLLTTPLVRPPGDGVVFAPHYYPISHPTDVEAHQANLQHWADVGQSWQTPVLVGEFGGWNDVDYTNDYMNAVHGALDALLLSGTRWEYSISSELWNSEDLSLVDGEGNETAQAETLLRAYPRAIAGESPSTSWDPSTKELALRFAPAAGGVSEIALPARAYPKGFLVHVKGGCADATHAGTLLVRADSGAAEVVVEVGPK